MHQVKDAFDLKLEIDQYHFKKSQIHTTPNTEARHGFNESIMYLLPKDGGMKWRNFSLPNNLRLPGRKNPEVWTSRTVGQMEIQTSVFLHEGVRLIGACLLTLLSKDRKHVRKSWCL